MTDVLVSDPSTSIVAPPSHQAPLLTSQAAVVVAQNKNDSTASQPNSKSDSTSSPTPPSTTTTTTTSSSPSSTANENNNNNNNNTTTTTAPVTTTEVMTTTSPTQVDGAVLGDSPSETVTPAVEGQETLPELQSPTSDTPSTPNGAATTNGRPPRSRSAANREHEAELMRKRVFIGNIGRQCTEDDIRKVIGDRFGHVEAINIIRDHTTHQSKGYGFIAFPSEDAAQRCIQLAEQQPLRFGTRQLNFRVARRRDRGVSDPPRRNRGSRRPRGASLDANVHSMYPHAVLMPDQPGSVVAAEYPMGYEGQFVMPFFMQPSYQMSNAHMMNPRGTLLGAHSATPYSHMYASPIPYSQPEYAYAHQASMMAPYVADPTRYPPATYGGPRPIGLMIDETAHSLAGLNLNNQAPNQAN